MDVCTLPSEAPEVQTSAAEPMTTAGGVPRASWARAGQPTADCRAETTDEPIAEGPPNT